MYMYTVRVYTVCCTLNCSCTCTLYTCSRSPFFYLSKALLQCIEKSTYIYINLIHVIVFIIFFLPPPSLPHPPPSPSTHTNTQSQDPVAPTAVGQSLSTLLTAAPPTMLTSSPNFSFSAPKSVSSESGPSQSTSKQTLKQVSQSTYFTEHILVANNI